MESKAVCVKKNKEIRHVVLLNLSSFAFRCRIERCPSVGDGPRDHLANAHWAMTACPWRFIKPSLAIKIPVCGGKRRVDGTALGRICDRRVDWGLRNSESSERSGGPRRLRRSNQGRGRNHRRGRCFVTFAGARASAAGAGWCSCRCRFARVPVRESKTPPGRGARDSGRESFQEFGIGQWRGDGSFDIIIFLFDHVEKAWERASRQFGRKRS